jgi:hypothetical protein
MATNMTNEEQLRQQPGSLVQQMVTELASAKAVDVQFETEDDAEWAVVKTHNYEEDKEMSLRLLSKDRWVLQLGYYDKKDDFIELLQELTSKETALIPTGLQKVMLKVLASEEGLRVPGSVLGAI